MLKNLVLLETEFDDFKQYCKEKGFDLSYFSSELSGSREEMESYTFDSPKVIRLKRRRFGFQGVPFDVAEWQHEKWIGSFKEIRDEFFKNRKVVVNYLMPRAQGV